MEVRCVSCKNYFNDMFEVCPYCGYVLGAVPKENFLLYPGRTLKKRYEIGMVLGYGGFGAIYKAWDTKLETSVAIKEYFQAGVVNRIPGDEKVFVFSDKKQVEYKRGLGRFLEEAKNTVKFSKHDNIVNVYDYFEENGTAYIVMEYLQGKNLKDILNENDESLDVETSLKIFNAILQALKTVHTEEVIHRDISPDNIFLTDTGKIKLIDFGAARFNKKKPDEGEVVVKPGFTPPEQYRTKEKQGTWTDIYSVGATMYRILTGVTPQESIGRVVKDELVPPNEIQPVIPEFLSSIIMKCMRLEPALRFKKIEDVESALRRGKIIKSRKQEIQLRKNKRAIIFALILMVCGLLGLGGSIAFNRYIKDENEKEVDLSLWLCVAEENREEELNAFKKTAEVFMKQNPNYRITVNCYEKDEIERKMKAAQSLGTMPDLFEVVDTIAMKETQEAIPLTKNVSLIYTAIGSTSDSMKAVNTIADFLDGKGNRYVGDLNCYLDIREMKLGEYEVKCAEPCVVEYDNFISINTDMDRGKKKKAQKFVDFLQQQQAQEILCIEHSNGLPIDCTTEEMYFEIYSELAVLKQVLESNQ